LLYAAMVGPLPFPPSQPFKQADGGGEMIHAGLRKKLPDFKELHGALISLILYAQAWRQASSRCLPEP